MLSLPSDVRGVLESGERVLWFDRPVFIPYIAGNLVKGLLVFVFMLFFIGFALMFPWGEIPIFISFFFLLFFVGFPALIGFSAVFYPILVWRNILYVVTDRRIIVRKGLVGLDYDFLSLEYVQRVDVQRGFLDVRYGSGTIVIQAVGVSSTTLYSIRDPFRVQDIISDAVSRFRESKSGL